MVSFVSCHIKKKKALHGYIRAFIFFQLRKLYACLKCENRLEIYRERAVLNNVVMLYSIFWGDSPEVRILYADVSEHSIPSS